jgi:hypothetical protein
MSLEKIPNKIVTFFGGTFTISCGIADQAILVFICAIGKLCPDLVDLEAGGS